MRNTILLFSFVVLACICEKSALAQDPHFTQFYKVQQLYNPALVGNFEDDIRVSAHHRSQYRSTDTKGFVTNALNAEGNFFVGSGGNHFSAGVFVLNDKAGKLNWNTFQALGSASYHLVLSQKDRVSVGLQGGILQMRVDPSALSWDAQYDGVQYVPSLDNKEDFANTSFKRLDFGFGGNFSHRGKTRYGAGYALRHMGQNIGVTGVFSDALPVRHTLMANFENDISFGALRYEILLQKQRTALELNIGARMEYRIGQDSKYTRVSNSSAVFGGLYYRLGEAICPIIGGEWRRIVSGFISYDFPLTGVSGVTGALGGPELTVVYNGRFRDRKTKLAGY
jgi:type IX secretion system PorP/SprF family membrane protein